MLELILLLASGFPDMDKIPSNGASPSRTVFAIPIGEPITFPQCKTKALTRNYISYETNYGQPLKDCWRHKFGSEPGSPIPTSGQVNVALNDLPSGFQWDGITLTLVNGRVESVSVMTKGLSAQDNVLEALVAKFGEPSSRDDVPTQNRMGASFTRKSAIWHFDDLLVVFVGLGTKIDNGIVSFSSPAGEAFEKSQKAAEEATKRQL